MAANAAQQARHQAVRRRVLARFQAEHPDVFARYWEEARADVHAAEAARAEAAALAEKTAKRSAAARLGWERRQGLR